MKQRIWHLLNGHERFRLRVRALLESRQLEAAQTLVDRALARFPKSSSLLVLSARISANSNDQEHVRRLLAQLETAKVDDPHDQFEIGELYRKLGEYQKSIQQFELACQGGSREIRQISNQVLASVYMRLKQPERAMEAVIQCLENGGWQHQYLMIDVARKCPPRMVEDAIKRIQTTLDNDENCARDLFVQANQLKMQAYFSLTIGRTEQAITMMEQATKAQFVAEHPAGGWDDSVEPLKPAVLIIGSMKSGTSSLFRQLLSHPQFVTPLNKELHFFQNEDWPEEFYLAQFPRVSQTNPPLITGEASPGYYALDIVERVAKVLPDVKVIFIKRDPVDRAISHLFHNRRKAVQEHSSSILSNGMKQILELKDLSSSEFQLALKDIKLGKLKTNQYLFLGCYDLLMKRWHQAFGEDRLLTIDFNDFSRQLQPTMDQVFQFLGIAPHLVEPQEEINAGTYRAKSPELVEVRRALGDFYREMNSNAR